MFDSFTSTLYANPLEPGYKMSEMKKKEPDV